MAASQTQCQQVDCPGKDVVGPHSWSLHSGSTVDPFLHCLPHGLFPMGAGLMLDDLNDAQKTFIFAQFGGQLGDQGRLEIYPDLSGATRNMYSTMGQCGGLLEGHPDLATLLADPTIPTAKKNMLKEIEKKYKGEVGEEGCIHAAINAMQGQEGAIIHGHKTALSLVEDKLEKDTSLSPEARLDVLFAFIGVTPDKNIIKGEVDAEVIDYFGSLGPQTLVSFQQTIANVSARTTGNKHVKNRRKKDMETLKAHLDENQHSQSPLTSLDPANPLLQAKLRKELNKHKREHDLTVIRPDYKTVVHAEVKTVTANMGKVNQVVEGALNQLRGGKEEIKRVHGHLLDQDWSYLGLIILPNLTSQDRNRICADKSICDYCKQYILVNDITVELNTIFSNLFTTKYPDEVTWRPAYKSLLSRLISLVSMVPCLPGDSITGSTEDILGGFTDKDIVNLMDCSISDIEKWREAGHRGSPVKMLFLNRIQIIVWLENWVAFLADYGVGKTTLIKCKATQLAFCGHHIGIFFLGTEEDGIEPVMGVWNKKKFIQISPNITALSTADLRQFYHANGGTGDLSGIKLVAFYLQHSSPAPGHNHTFDSVFMDEAGVEMTGTSIKPDETATVQALKEVRDQLPVTGHLWVAYHSKHLVHDIGSTPANHTQLQSELTAAGFTIPSLVHNMRNSDQVASAAAATAGFSLTSSTVGMDRAILPPRAPPTLTSPLKPLWIKCQSTSGFSAGVVKGYRNIQQLSAGAPAPVPVVVMCHRVYSHEVFHGLVDEGIPVTWYYSQGDRPGLDNYLDSPMGVLLTGQVTFSGMESSYVVHVVGGGNSRGAQLRATQTLVYVNTASPSQQMKTVFEIKNI